MWAKVYQVEGVDDGVLSNATLQVWIQDGVYKLNVSNSAPYNGDYGQIAAKSGGSSLQLIQFEEISEDQHFEYKPGTTEKGIIYVTPTGVSIVTEN